MTPNFMLTHRQSRHPVGVGMAVSGVVMALLLVACASSLPALEVREGDPAAERTYALGICAQRHNVPVRSARIFGSFGAPDFYAPANAKTTSMLGLNASLMTPHPTMPNLMITPEDRRNVIAYILSLRRATKPEATGI